MRALVDYAEAHPEVGIVGPRLRDGQGNLQIYWRLRPTVGTFLVRTAKTVSGRDLGAQLLHPALEVTGFRDLSRSTRSFLGMDTEPIPDDPIPEAPAAGASSGP